MSLFVFFISLLIVAEHVSGNHVPIIRSWRLRDVIALCWYVLWLQGGCQDRLAGNASIAVQCCSCSVFTVCATSNVISLRNMFCTFTSALSRVCVQCQLLLFSVVTWISCFPGQLLRCSPSDLEMVPVIPVHITGITFAFTFHMYLIYIIRSSYFQIFSASVCFQKLQHLLTCMLLFFYRRY